MSDLSELKAAFFGGHPDSTHEYDRERFLRYAFAAAREKLAFDRESFASAGVRDSLIHEYERAYSWIRCIVSMQERGEKLL